MARQATLLVDQPATAPAPTAEMRLALLYSDGSLGICAEGTTLEKAQTDREEADAHEADPAHLTKILRVRYEVVEVLFNPTAAPVTKQDELERLRKEVASLKARLREQSP